MEYVKLVIFVPESHAEVIRDALGKAGAGKVGNYSYCTFSAKGVGRFMPLEGSNPWVGKEGVMEAVKEERIETICLKKDIQRILTAVKKVHPYDAIAVDVYPLLNDPHQTM